VDFYEPIKMKELWLMFRLLTRFLAAAGGTSVRSHR
jgi:hypothetical protein